MFDKKALSKNITTWNKENKFNSLLGFGMLISANTTYYVSDNFGRRIYKFDDSWNYINYKSFSFKPAYMVIVKKIIYITGDDSIYKTDANLNVLKIYNSTISTLYRGVYYNSSISLLYVAAEGMSKNRIDVFDRNLTLKKTVQIKYRPFSIVGFNSILYIGTYEGMILVMVNRIIIKSFNGCHGNTRLVTSILFDEYSRLTSSCFGISQAYLYSSNGNFLNRSLSTAIYPVMNAYDSKGRFVMLSKYQISVYPS